jgi:hypothetical protein
MGAVITKSTCLYLYLFLLFSFPTKSATAIPDKFWFVSFDEHFEALPFLPLAMCPRPLHSHCLEYINCYMLCVLQHEVEIRAGRSKGTSPFSPSVSRWHIFLRIQLSFKTCYKIFPPHPNFLSYNKWKS